MSKIGKINIAIPEKVKVLLNGNTINVEGPLGKKSLNLDTDLFDLKISEGKEVSIKPKKVTESTKRLWGMKRSLFMAKEMVHQQPIIILDEPTAGVDVDLRKTLWENVKSLNAQGVTTILTTHYLEEAEKMCDRIGILNKGDLVALDTTKNLLKRIQTKTVRFSVNKKVNINNNSLKSINIKSNEINELVISYEKNAINVGEIIKFINDQNIKLLDISTDDGDLEDVFIRLTKN